MIAFLISVLPSYGSLKANYAKEKRNKKFGMGVGYFSTVETVGYFLASLRD
jgi:hypothetical protein